MGKNFRIVPQVNLLEEAIIILCVWMNKDNIEELWPRYRESFQDDQEVFQSRKDLFVEIYQCIKEQFKERREIIEYYFKAHGTGFSALGHLALLWNSQKCDNSLLSYQERFAGITEEQKVKQYAGLIDIDAALNTPISAINTVSDLIAFIESSAYEKEIKWEAIKIYSRQEFYYNEVCGILAEVVEFLRSRYGDRLERLGQEFYEYWTGVQQETDIIDLIQEKTKITWQSNNSGTIMMPSVFQPFSIGLYTDDVDRSLTDILRIGIMMDRRIIIANKSISQEDVVNAGKLLSDKSKVDILELLSKKPCYGKELANELKLSTATISYHVNALISIGLLSADVNANKIYYSVNRERLSEYLENVKEYFAKL